MDQRKMMLPEGWYPHSQAAAENTVTGWESEAPDESFAPSAGVVPHAGWIFSGNIAWKVISSIPLDTELVIVAGGHLSESSRSKVLLYSSLETPFGNLAVSTGLMNVLCSDFVPDEEADNTVEIQLPLIKYHIPDVQILPVRLASNSKAGEWGEYASRYCREKNIKAFFLGSTDLTHYGSRFGYNIYGSGDAAKERVRELDRSYLELLAAMKGEQALEFARAVGTACSAGAASGAAAFAADRGIKEGRILEQKYSYDVYTGETDFVGYGSVLY